VEKKIKVAFIYKKNYHFFDKNHFDQTTYEFFIKALNRNDDLQMEYFPCQNKFDCKKLKSKFDIILLPNNLTDGTPDELTGIKEIDIPVVCRTGDPHNAKNYNQFQFHEKWNIKYYFNFMHEDYFYKFYPRDFKYETIKFGIETENFEKIDSNYEQRKKNEILISGALGKNNIKSRIANSVLNPKSSGWYFYKLRTICNDLDYVVHSREIEKKLSNVTFPQILSKYFAAIAATTFYPTIKYWETSAAGCLTFMEITEKNNGQYLGYEDGKNAVFINEKNYLEKFEEFLTDKDNPKWVEIAKRGQEFTIKQFSNDVAVKKLVNLFNKII
tara:strand:+ start:4821 stop:5804 length:984 start_codon:yes stop_codon:yes gene_type:complete